MAFSDSVTDLTYIFKAYYGASFDTRLVAFIKVWKYSAMTLDDSAGFYKSGQPSDVAYFQ
jgi:hypothetical protein